MSTTTSTTAAPMPVVPPEADAPALSPRSHLRVYAWEATKTAMAAIVFGALLLPLAFPSRAGTQGGVAQISMIEAPAPAAAARSLAKAAPSSGSTSTQSAAPSPAPAAAKNGGVPQPAKKPLPKNT